MAQSCHFPWSTLNLFCLFLLLTAVTSNETTTSYDWNGTDPNATYYASDNYTVTQYTEFTESTTPTPSYSSTQPPEKPHHPREPLPVSGLLPTPVTSVASFCPCARQQGVCEPLCCCDRACVEELALFPSCSLHTVSGGQQLCSHVVASYSLETTIDGYSELRASVHTETSYDVFCIQSQNRVDGLSHPSPALPTDSNFDGLFELFGSFMFGPEENSGQTAEPELSNTTGYKYGDVMDTAAQGGHRGTLLLPSVAVPADCVDNSAAVFLQPQSSVCTRRLLLGRDCSSLPALSMGTYTDIHVFTGKNEDAVAVPVTVASVVLQSVDGTQTELRMSDDGEKLSPVLLDPTVCANVVLKVSYCVTYNPSGEVVAVSAAVVLGFVHEAALPLEQEFQITFIQEDAEMAVHNSGNPGYVVGLPLVSGTRTADGISRSMEPRDTLSLLSSSEDQDCLRGRHQRSPVLFGLDSVSGCTLRLEDTADCSVLQQVLLDVLRGPNYPQYVASFGNSPLDSPLDWLPIKTNVNPGEAQGCSIPLSLHLEIEWTKYGTLVNPQAQIVSVQEVIQTNTSSLVQLSGGSGVVSVSTSVSFSPVSAAALPGYRATPTLNAKLPNAFFFPFV